LDKAGGQNGGKATHRLCDYEGSAYRTDFWEDQGRDYEDRVERLALRSLLPPSGRRLVDIGAGFGRLATIYKGYDHVILLDYSRSQLEYARQQLGDERFTYVAADIYNLPLATNAVDTAVMVRVLHHLADVPLVLQQVKRVTRDEGIFVLEFANKRHLKNIVRYLLGRGVNPCAAYSRPFDRHPYEFADLHYDFHPAWVAHRLQEAGFEIERRLSVSNLRSALLKRVFPISLLLKMEGVLQRGVAPLALGPSIFLRASVNKVGGNELVGQESLFRCPTCGHEPLVPEEDHLRCVSCQSIWPIEKGIYIFK